MAMFSSYEAFAAFADDGSEQVELRKLPNNDVIIDIDRVTFFLSMSHYFIT